MLDNILVFGFILSYIEYLIFNFFGYICLYFYGLFLIFFVNYRFKVTLRKSISDEDFVYYLYISMGFFFGEVIG